METRRAWGATRPHRFHHVDLRDRDGLVRCARGIDGLAAVFTAGTDFSSSVAYVSEHLSLPGIPFETALDATDKGRMRRCLAAAGVPVPRFAIIDDAGSGRRGIEELSYPLVCKPADNMGARGVRLVDGPDPLDAAIADARSLAPSRRVIVEERIPGAEFSLDAIVVDGVVRVTGLAERHISFAPWFVEMGHTIPAGLDDRDRAALEDTFRRAIHAVGITRGAAKGDLFLCEGEPRVMVGEIAARLSGGYMSGWTYPISSGVPLTSLAVRTSLGHTPSSHEFAPRHQRIAVERAEISVPGVVRHVEVPSGWDHGRNLPPGVDAVFIHCRVGQSVVAPRNNVEKVANVIAHGETRAEAERAAHAALDRIRIDVDTAPEETRRFLFHDGWHGMWARFLIDADLRGLMETGPAMFGDPEAIATVVRRGDAIPVAPLSRLNRSASPFPDLPSRLHRRSGRRLLEAMIAAGEVRMVEDDAAVGTLFWRAFLAGERQGVRVLRRIIATDGVDAATRGEAAS